MANLGYIQITRACNQNCRFCSNPDTGKSLLPAQVKKIVDDYKKAGYIGVLFTGGEPTLHPDLAVMISWAVKKGIAARVITNAQVTADISYLKLLVDNGLNHLMVSIYSCRDDIQGYLSNNRDSFSNIRKTFNNAGELGIRVDVITVISKYNAGHLSDTVKWIVENYPFVTHFIWNNIDPMNNRASKNTDTIAKLNDFELELHQAMFFLTNSNRTFRVERVPLCYMSEFEHYSTETRKIVKGEERSIYFLDDKGYVTQKGDKSFLGYSKPECCKLCSLNTICAGLYAGGIYYSYSELYPEFISKETIIRKIVNND